jgi:NAD(P)-dependent dehydrogenase (short-subunit alcohol dehydrogenase family)
MCYGAGCPGNLESVSRALQHISLALPRFVNLSNWAACEFDVSLGPDGGRKIFSKISPGAQIARLEARQRAKRRPWLNGYPGWSLCTATKHAVTGMTKAAAVEYAIRGIRVNAVGPGPVETPLLANGTGGDKHSNASFVPMGRIGQPVEIADPDVFLVSDEPRYVTGHETVDTFRSWAMRLPQRSSRDKLTTR